MRPDTTASYNSDTHPFGVDISQLSVVELFEQTARRYPDHVGVRCEGRGLTYAELDRAANRLAHAILECAQGDEPVALLFEHDIPAIIAIWGALKAAKPYLPFTPLSPVERIKQRLEHAQTRLIITDNRCLALAESVAGMLQQPRRVTILNLDTLDQSLPDTSPGLALSPDSVVYVSYTSGSTGQPKGVIKRHLNVLYSAIKEIQDMHLSHDDRYSMFFSYSFGASNTGIFGAPLAGATLNLYDLRQNSLTNMATWLQEEQITILYTVPTVLRHLCHQLSDRLTLPDLRLIILGGESLTRHDLDLFKQYFPKSSKLINKLALSEAGALARYVIDHDTPVSTAVVPVGYPYPGRHIALVDEHGQEVGVNQLGEIVVTSRYMSPGYWRRPDLTQAAFEPDPDGGEERTFRTGDLGYFLPDGSLVHVGRKDRQIKIRGYRVETVEVEVVLMDLAAVQEAVVTAYDDHLGEKRLAAYVVPHEGESISIGDLRNAVTKTLPDYMVPSAFITLDGLPLTATGKVDRGALPAPTRMRPDLDVPLIPPRDDFETRLAGIWQELLGVTLVGVKDGFLDLGGHSLLATKLIAEIEKEFGKRISLATLSRVSTIEQIAVLLGEEREQPPARSLVTLAAGGVSPPLYLIHPRGGHLLRYHHLVRLLAGDQPIFGLQALGLDGKTAPLTSIEEMAAHYVREIHDVQPEGPYYLCGFSLGGMIAFEVARQLDAQGQAVALLAMIDTLTPAPPLKKIENQIRDAGESADRYRGIVGSALKKDLGHLRRLTAREFLPHVWSRVRHIWYWQVQNRIQQARYKRNPEQATTWPPEKRVRWACSAAKGKYVARPYSGKITLFKATQHKKSYIAPQLLWGKLAQGGIEVIEVPGTHRSILEEPGVRVLAEKLKQALAQARD
jgi:amino acid adenylation domain-containing protein